MKMEQFSTNAMRYVHEAVLQEAANRGQAYKTTRTSGHFFRKLWNGLAGRK
ncbi:hypothetical protein AAC03nite_01010 [Alicyclobacillus acidoterrestris]|uniref:hypothetical protein n=1 Tax=Alicyclobacillus suci TaxID=2816080 RepID=UPI001191F786|nr:hypothetical protein [Alicyclobacillus suci]GEO24316.1 hypothetical protein AAC03nite_01010 [Alicyclobacillus acidoterrestris]